VLGDVGMDSVNAYSLKRMDWLLVCMKKLFLVYSIISLLLSALIV
jgi:hypothetical protein